MKYNLLSFIIFISVFFSIYGGLHFYCYTKFKAVWKPDPFYHFLFVLFLVLMVLSPVAMRMLERNGYYLYAKLSAYIGYWWMGALFLFVSISFGFDLYKMIIRLFGALFNFNPVKIIPPAGFTFLFTVVVTIGILIYGYFEARTIQVEYVTVKSEKVNHLSDKMRIVQISDIHLGLIVGQGRLEKMLDLVEAQSPDILVSTGDLVDGHISKRSQIIRRFREVQPQYGKFAVVGNHEYYSGLEESIAFTEECGFKMLRGKIEELPKNFRIGGVDDKTRAGNKTSQIPTESEMFEKYPGDGFTVFLKHQPRINKNTLGKFDLMLSGHVHSGQIFPFTIITYLAYGFKNGLNLLDKGSYLYLSRGTGTWGPPIRFIAPPEITVIDIVSQDIK